jgi:hypothetical protein
MLIGHVPPGSLPKVETAASLSIGPQRDGARRDLDE